MTMLEREQWLIDRGIQIEKSDDASKLHRAISGTVLGDDDRPMTIVEQVNLLSVIKGGSSSNSRIQGVKFVFVPHDTSKPISEVTLPSPLVEVLGPAGDILPTYVRSYFADGNTIDERLFREQVGRQKLMCDKPIELSSNAIMNATSSGSVETFPLVRPSSTNNHQGVYIYLDEVGMLKKLPLNIRASKIAGQCGYHPQPKFYGDVFIGRVEAKPSHYMYNIDLQVKDVVDAKSEWLVNAPRENLEWTQALNQATKGNFGTNTKNEINDGTDGIPVHVQQDNGRFFSWLQCQNEIEVTLPLLSDADAKEGKIAIKSLMNVIFLRKKITVKYNKNLLLELNLYEEIDVDGCTWTLDKDMLVITCEKYDGGKIWPRLE
ncbi:hypothetical protein ACHAWX_001071 [Stephanocyclus meneghinianus]